MRFLTTRLVNHPTRQRRFSFSRRSALTRCLILFLVKQPHLASTAFSSHDLSPDPRLNLRFLTTSSSHLTSIPTSRSSPPASTHSVPSTTVHMTSTASQPASTPAPNNTAASTAPSYASAAGASKKPASTPLVVTGANPPSVVGSSAASASTQNAPSPVNGRQSIPPAVPTIANGTSSLNGDSADHSRNGSVSITAPGNGYTNKAAAPGIQFGFEKTPQPSSAVPIPAGGGNAQPVPSPAASPAPIPQPSASGGKPGATDSQFKIGSFPNDSDVSRPFQVHAGSHCPISPFFLPTC